MQRDHCHVVRSMWYISAGLSKCHLWVDSINDSRPAWTFGAAGAACWIRDSGRMQAGNLCFNKPPSGLSPPHISGPLWQQNRRFSGRRERSLCFWVRIMYACGENCVCMGRGGGVGLRKLPYIMLVQNWLKRTIQTSAVAWIDAYPSCYHRK